MTIDIREKLEEIDIPDFYENSSYNIVLSVDSQRQLFGLAIHFLKLKDEKPKSFYSIFMAEFPGDYVKINSLEDVEASFPADVDHIECFDVLTEMRFLKSWLTEILTHNFKTEDIITKIHEMNYTHH